MSDLLNCFAEAGLRKRNLRGKGREGGKRNWEGILGGGKGVDRREGGKRRLSWILYWFKRLSLFIL